MKKDEKYMSASERIILTKMLNLMDKMPQEKLWYILGYMQSEADKNLSQKESNG